MMPFGELVGWLGIACGLLVAPPQLIKIIQTKCTNGISLLTYIALFFALIFYLLHAIYIHSLIFITAQSINLVVNGAIVVLLVRRKLHGVPSKPRSA